MSGCKDDDVVDVVVYSERLGQSMFKIINGRTEPVEIIAHNKDVGEPRRKINRLRDAIKNKGILYKNSIWAVLS